MRRHLSILALLASLAACAGQPAASTRSTPTADLGTTLAHFTLADLQNAATDAKAHGDTVAALCYTYLAGQLTSATTGENAPVSGPISAFQRLRDVQQAVGSGISQNFQLNCAPLLSDTQANVLKLGALGTGIVGVGMLP
jgi:hypothetical protein